MNKKQEIITRSEALLRKKGYFGISMSEIAKSVNLSKSSLYNYFSSKDELIEAILEYKLNTIKLELMNYKEEANWQDQFYFAINKVAEILKNDSKCLGLQLAYELEEEQIKSLGIQSFFELIYKTLFDILTNYYPIKTAEHIAKDSISMLEGATLWMIIDNSFESIDRAVDRILGISSVTIIDKKTLFFYENISDSAKEVLNKIISNNRLPSLAEMKLAVELEAYQDECSKLRSFIEAESCFK